MYRSALSPVLVHVLFGAFDSTTSSIAADIMADLHQDGVEVGPFAWLIEVPKLGLSVSRILPPHIFTVPDAMCEWSFGSGRRPSFDYLLSDVHVRIHFRIPKLISISRQTHEIDLEIGFASGCEEGEVGFPEFRVWGETGWMPIHVLLAEIGLRRFADEVIWVRCWGCYRPVDDASATPAFLVVSREEHRRSFYIIISTRTTLSLSKLDLQGSASDRHLNSRALILCLSPSRSTRLHQSFLSELRSPLQHIVPSPSRSGAIELNFRDLGEALLRRLMRHRSSY
ncbi:hypothetical protein SISSUDRAFT_1123323, partial [Sistotremastrum suecicum HHB10207 ss-3]